MRIPADKIDEIRQASDIVDVIGGFVKLKKRGKNYVGLCPFHTEKTPSFSVSPDRQMYYCFGCGEGGNVFTFLMAQEKVSFVEAVRALAERAGITLPTGSPESEQFASEQEQLYEICREAGRFFHKSLTESAEGKFALDYFHHRGFTDDTIRAFGLGYAPNTWDALISHAARLSTAPELLARAGLARRRDDGTYYDYFRGRAMFPVFSPTGRVIGFGARKLYEDDPIAGKYINSPETPIYEKSKSLFGVFHARDALRERDSAILVEGYADLISLFQAGIRNVVASSGTALTSEQILLIGRYTKNVTIVYDADSAGSKAALRGVDLVLEHDLDVRVVQLPEGEDPDTFVRASGADAFRKLLDGAVSFIDFIADAFEREGKFGTPEGQTQTVRSIVRSIAKMGDELKRNFFIKHVAEKYGIYESTLHRELEKQLGLYRRERIREAGRVEQPAADGIRREPPVSETAAIPVPELDVLHAMLSGGTQTITYVFDTLSLDEFTHPTARKIAGELQRLMEEGEEPDPSRLFNSLENEAMKQTVAQIVFSRYALSKSWEEQGIEIGEADAGLVARGAIIAIRRRAIEKAMEENQKKMREASRRGENVDDYLRRHQEYLTRLQELQRQ